MSVAVPLKVLIIEDDKVTRRELREMLESGGCIVAEAAQGEIGVELAKRFAPSVILLDLLLPDLEGEEVLNALKLDVLTADTPVVIVSIVRREQSRLGDHAVAGYLVKPVVGGQLLTVVRQVVAARMRLRSPEPGGSVREL